ncbi:LysR family transcriptional regulator [Streptomyces sp. NPDC056653]|uniref:LysR family transcriptional regulator n=1 Tax=Streptomyces sp. NPDC056653 TaxID=3345894 RepID=UPI003690DBF6
MSYELTDLRLFHAIAEAQSLSQGATALYLTASSASYRLKNLEHALGTPLFTRTARGMKLTPAGETLLVHVRALLSDIRRMNADIAFFSQGLKGSIRLWANSSSLNGFILPVINQFLLTHPDVNIDLEERTSRDIPGGVAVRDADIGVLAGPVDSEQLRVDHYATDELIIVTALDHPLAGHAEIRFGAVLPFDFVCMSRSSSNYLFLLDMAKRAGGQLNVRLRTDGFDALLRLVEDNVGIALVPLSVAEAMVNAARIAAVRLLDPWARRELHLITIAEPTPPLFVQSLVDFLLTDPRVASTR